MESKPSVVIQIQPCYIPADSAAEPVLVNKILGTDPLLTGIDLIDQNPAMHQVSQQTRKQLATLALIVGEWINRRYSRNLEDSHINEIDNKEEETDIVFELGGQLYGAEKTE